MLNRGITIFRLKKAIDYGGLACMFEGNNNE